MRILCKLGTSEGLGQGSACSPCPAGVGPAPPRELGEYCWLSCSHAAHFTASALIPHQQTQTDSPAGPLCLQWEAQPGNKEPSGGLGFLECPELSEQTGAT